MLTPYENGSVNLSFNDGPVQESATFTHKGNVLTAEFKNVGGAGALYIVILDTVAKNGYEFVHMASKPAFASKMACLWFAK